MVGGIVGKKEHTRDMFFDEDGRIRDGTVIIKLVGKSGPYGYRVRYRRQATRGEKGSHEWDYLGLAEPGLATGSYAPGVPLKFYRGRKRKLEEKDVFFVGNWDSIRVDSDLDSRLEDGGYLEEVLA